MIKITFTEDAEILSLRVEGHAGYAEIGKDIVCSSASILAYTVAKIVNDALAKGWLKVPPIMTIESGKTLVLCEPLPEHFLEVESAYNFAKEGFQLLSQNYSEYVKLRLDINKNKESLT